MNNVHRLSVVETEVHFVLGEIGEGVGFERRPIRVWGGESRLSWLWVKRWQQDDDDFGTN